MVFDVPSKPKQSYDPVTEFLCWDSPHYPSFLCFWWWWALVHSPGAALDLSQAEHWLVGACVVEWKVCAELCSQLNISRLFGG